MKQEPYRVIIQFIHIDIQDIDFFDPGPGTTGLGHHH